MKSQEIGGYFSIADEGSFLPMACAGAPQGGTFEWGEDRLLLASGRSALWLILEDLQGNDPHRAHWVAYVPSYCCQALLDPFFERGIEVKYYSVEYVPNQGIVSFVDTDTQCDIFLAMSYFGFSSKQSDAEAAAFAERGVTVIEDTTHRLLSAEPYAAGVHYSFASLRKWFPVPAGGLAVKHLGRFDRRATQSIEPMDTETMRGAMELKRRYLGGEPVDKKVFLRGFTDFNRQLSQRYARQGIDEHSRLGLARMDVKTIRQRRRDNAALLIDGMREFCPTVGLQKWNSQTDVPLFVPIVVEPDMRDSLVRHLVDRDIFSPVHWPQPTPCTGDRPDSGLYTSEVSLICDQRYSERDMEKVINAIADYMATYA